MITPSSETCPLEGGTGHSPCFALEKKKNAMFPQSKEGKSPLHMAAIHGRFTRSQILIQNGMDLEDFVISSPPSENSSLETPFLPHSTPHPIFQSGWAPEALSKAPVEMALLCLPGPLRLTNEITCVEGLAWPLARNEHSDGS